MELCSNKLPTPMSRREMLKMSGGSIGFGGVALNALLSQDSIALRQPQILPEQKESSFCSCMVVHPL